MSHASKRSYESSSSLDPYSKHSLFSKGSGGKISGKRSGDSHAKIFPSDLLNPEKNLSNNESFLTETSRSTQKSHTTGQGDNPDEVEHANWEILIQIHEDKIRKGLKC